MITVPRDLGFRNPRVVLPGILALEGPPYDHDRTGGDSSIARFVGFYKKTDPINVFPLIVVVDDSSFAVAEPAKLPVGYLHP